MGSENITYVGNLVSSEQRWLRQKHIGGVLWLTGLPASGKSTLAFGLESKLFEAGFEIYAFGSRQIRQGLNKDLGYSREDRRENIRRAGELAAIMASSGLIVITSFISPYAADRTAARTAVKYNFHEIYLDATLTQCEARDTRRRYFNARRHRINNFTGISAPYEVPNKPDLILQTGITSITECLDNLVEYTEKNFRIPLSS